MMLSASDRLKKATADYHRLAEKSLINRLLLSPQIDKRSYALALARYYGIVVPLEARVKNSRVCREVPCTLRAPWLHRELLVLGWSPVDILNIPSPRSDQMSDSDAYAVGIAYVLEGSRSGGPIIRRQLQKYLGQSQFGQLSHEVFFENRDLQEVRTNWQSFKRQLDHWFDAQTEDAYEQACVAACDTFQLFAQWLNQPLSESTYGGPDTC